MTDAESKPQRRNLSGTEITAIAHLYRGEIYRSTTWRTRLDTTTNWAVVTLGVALSITFASPAASPMPLILVGVLILLFLWLEARRYRYFNVWRARARWLETHFYAPMLHDGDLHMEEDWQKTLANDYWNPSFHISFLTALGRRVRRSYLWILIIQSIAYVAKITVHPEPFQSMDEIFEQANIGRIPGEVVLAMGGLYVVTFLGLAIWSKLSDRRKHRNKTGRDGGMV